MNVAYEKLDNVRGKLTVKIEENDYADKVKAQLKEIRKSHAVPGFRPGKAPASMIEKKYGEAVKYDIVNKEIGNALFG
ncbi:MAG: trigger factor family protein, partial [Muribaculaceae bacterium]|nr:trigger factor family protein [Muribaculaceae bacterium]